MSDIIIIGGGVAGVSAAACLAPHAQVTLLETEKSLAYHASGRSAAMFIRDYGNASVKALNAASADHHHNADGGVLSRRGMMLVARADQGAAFHADASDLGLDEITLDEAAALWPILNPDTVGHAAYRPDAYDLDTDLLIQNYARRARAAGAGFVTGAAVSAITRDGARWRVTAGGQNYSADIIVNAAGAWADDIARMAGVAPIGIIPYRRSMARIAAPEGLDTSKWPFVDGVEESWYAKPDAGALIVSPSEEDPADPHDAWADDMVLAEGLARYEEMVTHPVTRMLANWAGLRSFAPDRTLVIGPDAHTPGFHWLAGQGGYGFQTAPAASQLAADLITGAAPALDAATITALSPARFA
ncbi:MAG: FAD-binding oxidoreductase [Sediminimonas sp.]|uniref:NAD(P)/FAD-dependent oxidoreductase n=1 Tax=Sediminimonas sp. TaxID=2823379 RepID=UPI00286FF259|nr:FAD-binding oxidoreductase [Sediminimonas sp.]MDR9483982.1 FAD-binding oxidoreductase [Sediminimonas sp.]